MFLALAQLTNKAFTDAGKGRIRQSLTALVHITSEIMMDHWSPLSWGFDMRFGDSHTSLPRNTQDRHPTFSIRIVAPQIYWVICWLGTWGYSTVPGRFNDYLLRCSQSRLDMLRIIRFLGHTFTIITIKVYVMTQDYYDWKHEAKLAPHLNGSLLVW